MHFLRIFAAFVWTAFVATLRLPADEPAATPRLLEGEIAGAHWAALVPARWEGFLLLEAPDLCHAPGPLVAQLDATTPEHQALIAVGWAVATTSYRRTGPILADAIDDLRALRDHLAAELGQPKIVLIDGTGMGGLIATMLAERQADEYHGFLARDPKFEIRDPRALRLRCDHQPRGPLLILFGAETATGVVAYQERARAAANAESVVPALWYLAPPESGAAADPNVAPVSRLGALQALIAWVQTRQVPASRLDNLPAAEPPAPSTETAPPTTIPAEAPLLPEEPPPTVPIDAAH